MAIWTLARTYARGPGAAVRSGTVLGFRYVVHPVWLLVFALLLVSLVTSLSGPQATDLPATLTVLVGAVVVALFIVSIVAHELAHALVARRLGLPQATIQLLTLGRPSEHEPDPVSPGSELAVAATGPTLSAGIGLLLVAASYLIPADQGDAILALYRTCLWLGLANLGLAAFHLVPVLPLDGGRIVRAIAWLITNDLDRATATAAVVGRLFGYVVVGSGLFMAMSIDLVLGLWLVLLGWFTTRLARASVDRRRMDTLTAGLTVSDATDTDPAIILPALAVETLLLEDAERGGQGVYPVVEDGRLLGYLFISRLRRPLRRKRSNERVADALVPVERAPTLRPDEPLMRAVERLETVGSDGLPVVSADDPERLYGVVTRARVLDRLRARHAMAQARRGSAPSDVHG